MKGQSGKSELLMELRKKYAKNPVQVTLRWHLQRGIIPLPKSSHPDRIRLGFTPGDTPRQEGFCRKSLNSPIPTSYIIT